MKLCVMEVSDNGTDHNNNINNLTLWVMREGNKVPVGGPFYTYEEVSMCLAREHADEKKIKSSAKAFNEYINNNSGIDRDYTLKEIDSRAVIYESTKDLDAVLEYVEQKLGSDSKLDNQKNGKDTIKPNLILANKVKPRKKI
ncbi:hypothetical protein [Castellaniella sp.]|uniref:hypothetical protein n=1 Tax=Castellaniella sp. TaxID=1955812 RepID=UPI003A952748